MKLIFIKFILIIITPTLFSEGFFLLNDNAATTIDNQAYIFADTEYTRTIETLLDEIDKKGIDHIPRAQFAGENVKYNAWAYFTITNNSTVSRWVLEYDYDRTGKRIVFYEIKNGEIINTTEDGDHIPWKIKPLLYRNSVMVFTLAPGESRDICILFSKPQERPFLTDLHIKIKIWPYKNFIEKTSNEHLFFGILLGIIIVMCLYHLVLYVSVKQIGYLYYSLFIFSLGILQLNTYGIIAEWFPTRLHVSYIISTFFPSFQGLTYILFSINLLNLRKRFPKSAFILLLLAIAMPILSLVFQLWNLQFATYIRNILIVVSLPLVVILAIRVAARGSSPALIYIISNAFFLSLALIGMLMQMSVIPYIHILSYSMDIGMILMIVLFSLALGDEINSIKREKEEAQQENTAKTMFLANMSHEMRTPLNGIIGFTELIQSFEDIDAIKKHTILIRKESNRLLFLINQLLDLSKVESGKITLNKGPFSVFALMNSIESSFEPRVKSKNLELITTVDTDLVSEWYIGDIDRIEQILVNLVGNAIKFTDEGTICIEVSCNDERVMFSVADTGIGIKESDHNRIFGAFIQSDSSIKRKYGGTGLGTTIAKELVKLMEGEIGYYPNKPRGTVFWFSLPLVSTTSPDFTKESHGLENEELAVLKNAQILVAEDYPTNQIIAQKHLESVNCRVDLAENGKIAVDMAQEKKYAIILMDVQMPEMDGLEATRIIKSKGMNTNTPVIAMTASAYDSERKECMKNGMDDVIAKPIRKMLFLKTVSLWIRKLPPGVSPH